MSGFLNDSHFHLLLLIFVLPTAFFAFGFSWMHHRRWRYLVPGITGLGLVVLAVLVGHDGPLGEVGERLLSFLGGLVLIFAHLMNMNRSKKLS